MNPSYAEIFQRAVMGRKVSPRGKVTREVPGLLTLQYQPGETFTRDGMPNPNLGLMEGLMMVAGIFSADQIKAVAPRADVHMWTPMAQYGPRVATQLWYATEKLVGDPATRQASIMVSSDQHVYDDELSCLLNVQWMLRDGALEQYATFRSWDLCLGLPNDLVMLSVLYYYVQAVLTLRFGHEIETAPMWISARSAHVYDDTRMKASTTSMGRTFRPTHELIQRIWDSAGYVPSAAQVDWQAAQAQAYQSLATYKGRGQKNWEHGLTELPYGFEWSEA